MEPADREILRTAWRVATAIGGDHDAGRRVLLALLSEGGEPRRLNESRVYRAAAGIGAESDGRSSDRAGAVAGDPVFRAAPARDRAAWVIVRVFDQPVPTACRALDLDASGVEQAIAAIDARVGGDLAGRLRACDAGVDIDAEIDAAMLVAAPYRKRRRWIACVQLLVLFICFGLLIFVMVDLLRWDDREAALRAESLRYSNPMPESGGGEPVRPAPAGEPAQAPVPAPSDTLP